MAEEREDAAQHWGEREGGSAEESGGKQRREKREEEEEGKRKKVKIEQAGERGLVLPKARADGVISSAVWVPIPALWLRGVELDFGCLGAYEPLFGGWIGWKGLIELLVGGRERELRLFDCMFHPSILPAIN